MFNDKKDIKKATDEQIIKAYEQAFMHRNDDIAHQIAYYVIKNEFDRRKLSYDDVRI